EEERPVEREIDHSKAYEDAFVAYLRSGMAELPREQREVLRTGMVTRDQATTPGSAGGYLVPEGFRAVITEALKAYGGLLQHANVITTSTGNPLPWPRNDDTSNVGQLLAENTQIGAQDVTFDQAELGAYTYTSKLM